MWITLYSKIEIGPTLSDYTTSAQLHTGLNSKVKTNLIFDTYTTTAQLYNCFYSKGYVNQMLVQSTTLFVLADKVPAPVMCHYHVIWTLGLHTQVKGSDAMLELIVILDMLN